MKITNKTFSLWRNNAITFIWECFVFECVHVCIVLCFIFIWKYIVACENRNMWAIFRRGLRIPAVHSHSHPLPSQAVTLATREKKRAQLFAWGKTVCSSWNNWKLLRNHHSRFYILLLCIERIKKKDEGRGDEWESQWSTWWSDKNCLQTDRKWKKS